MADRLMFLCLCLGLLLAEARGESLEFFGEPLPAAPTSLEPPGFRASSSADEGGSSPADESAVSRSQQELTDAMARRAELLADVLSAEGARSQQLIEHLVSLATLYQQADDHYPAIGALNRALELSRVHNGLHSLEQAELLEQMIASVTAVKEYGEAASLERRLLDVTYRNLNDPRVTLVLAASADRRVRETHRILEEERPVEVTVSAGSITPELADRLPSRRRSEALASLWGARAQYNDAIKAAVDNGGYAILDLLELEERLVATFFLELSHPELAPPPGSEGWLCASGEAVLANSLGNVSRFRRSATAVASTMIELADWRLLCSRNGRAVETYQSAYQTLLEQGADGDMIAELLSPEIPAALPAFGGVPPSEDGQHGYRGYVDVSFVVGKFGTARSIEILDRSAGTSKAIEKKLKGYIARHRFRPRIVDGEPIRADRVAVRYHYR